MRVVFVCFVVVVLWLMHGCCVFVWFGRLFRCVVLACLVFVFVLHVVFVLCCCAVCVEWVLCVILFVLFVL